MSNTALITKLNTAINGQMCAFLDTIADKYGMTSDNLKSDWANFSGMKPKAKKHSGPKLSDLKSKCKELDIPTSGTKTILEDRIAAFERGEIKTITQTRDEKKAAKEVKASSEKKEKKEKKDKKGKKRSSGKSSKSSKSSKSNKSSTSTKSSKSTSSGASLSELKSQLKAAGLPRTGNKAELDKRLAKFKAEQADGKVNYNAWSFTIEIWSSLVLTSFIFLSWHRIHVLNSTNILHTSFGIRLGKSCSIFILSGFVLIKSSCAFPIHFSRSSFVSAEI